MSVDTRGSQPPALPRTTRLTHSSLGRLVAMVLAMGLMAGYIATGSGLALTAQAATRAMASASSDFATLEARASTATTAPGGEDVTYTYQVTNKASTALVVDSATVFTSSQCGDLTRLIKGWTKDAEGRWTLAPEATASVSCTVPLSNTTTVEATVADDVLLKGLVAEGIKDTGEIAVTTSVTVPGVAAAAQAQGERAAAPEATAEATESATPRVQETASAQPTTQDTTAAPVTTTPAAVATTPTTATAPASQSPLPTPSQTARVQPMAVPAAVDNGNNACSSVWYVTFGGRYGEIGRVVNGTTVISATDKITTDYPSTAIAIDPTDPNAAYYTADTNNDGNWDLIRVDLSTGVEEIVNVDEKAWDTNRVAVDKQGTFWSLAQNGHLYSMPADAVNGVPTDHGIPSAVADGYTIDFTKLTSGDIAIDGNGTMWLLASTGTYTYTYPDGRRESRSGETLLMTIPASEIYGQTPQVNVVGKMTPPAGDYYNGIAFGSDGKLYATSSGSGLYVVDPNTGQTAQQSTVPATYGKTGDLASCAIPEPHVESAKAVKKADGTTGPVQPGDEMIYTITIKNTGSLGATDVKFSDKLPAGVEYVPGSTTMNGTEQVPDRAGATANDKFPYATPYDVKGSTSANWGYIEKGDQAVISFRVKVLDQAAMSADICNTGTTAVGGLESNTNEACTAFVRSNLDLAKKGVEGSVKDLGNNTYSAQYKVTVTNTGTSTGTYGPITDTLAFDKNLTPTKVTWSGQGMNGSQDFTAAPYTFTIGQANTQIPVNTTHTYTVDVIFTYSGHGVASECSGGPGAGLYNSVAMDKDADPSNNDDCLPPPVKDPMFSVSKTSPAGAITLPVGATTLTRTYTVTVKNTGEIDGTSPQVVDVPEAPQGFTITSVTVDGGTPQTSAPYLVTKGDTLVVGASKAHTVVVTYAVDQSKITPEAWTKLGECKIETGTTDATYGVYNKVTMAGDSDGVENNDACNPVEGTPKFQVKKEAVTPAITLGSQDTSATVEYKVTVANIGTKKGTPEPIIENPATPAGFTVATVTVDGVEVQAPYTLQARELNPGERQEFTVVVTYRVEPTSVSFTDLATCTTTTQDTSPSGSVANKVTMTGDSDGETNNDACVPVTSKSEFSVAKTTGSEPIVIKPGQTELSRSYTVTVTNNGLVAGTSAPVFDTPTVPAGMAITSVTIDGVVVAGPAPYRVTPGDALAPGASKAHTVVVVYTITDAGQLAWTDLGECQAEGATPDSSKGLYNLVTMAGDGDGVENNDTCTPVEGTSGVQIVKFINGDDANTAPGVTVEAGSMMQITFKVTNTGSLPLTDVVVTDDKVAAETIVCKPSGTNTIALLAAGETVECTAQLAAPQESDAQHTNVGTVTGKTPGGEEPKDDDPGNAHTPKFDVKKETAADPITLVKDQKQVTRTYTVTVTNSGSIDATSGKVVDTPSTPAGFTVASVIVDGGKAQTAAPYVVTEGVALKAGESQTFSVTVVYLVDQSLITADGWASLGECKAEGDQPDASKGLYNLVTMPGDSDGTDNNDTCTPVNGEPKFQVEKAAVTPSIQLGATDTEATVEYRVTVSNIGNVAGTPAAIVETPATPAGFTVATVTVDGVEVQAPYTLQAGELAAGASQTFTVTITYVVDATSVSFTDLATCTTTTQDTSPSGSVANKVTMEGDSDGETNNDACVPVEPKSEFAVEKSTTQQPLVLAPTATTATRTYTVKVTNTGLTTKVSPQVIDTPSQPSGFTITSVTVDQGQPQTAAPYVVTPGVELKAGESREFTVVVVYAVSQDAISSWTDLGECKAGTDASDPTKGLYNLVEMAGDSDGVENNDACTPVEGTPQFAVNKTTAQLPVVLPVDQTTLDVEYTVTVSNTGFVAGTSQPVFDTPAVRAGFAITKVTVDGVEVPVIDGRFQVTGGDELAKGQVKAHTVVVSYALTQKAIDWKQVGECTVTDSVKDPATGLYNVVEMEGDSDGQTNNDACVPVTPTDQFAVAKSTTQGTLTLATGQTSIERTYTVTVTNTGNSPATSKPVYDVPANPAGFAIAAVTVDGIAVEADAQGRYTVTSGDQLAAGDSKAHTVVVTYTVDQTAITSDGWVNLGQCQAEGATPDASKGLYNLVTMAGDSDGTDNNDVCNPVEGTPGIQIVKKINEDDANTAPGVEVKVGSMMAITFDVTNTGNQDLTDVVVTDDTVAADQIVCPASGSNTIALLKVGQTVQCTASLKAPESAGTQHTNVGTATGKTPGGEEPKDEDPGNAHTPKFRVEKTTAAEPLVIKVGQTSVERAYTVTVTNDGLADGTSDKVIDTPAVPTGFTITKVTVNGVEVAPTDGSYLVTPGAELAMGASASFDVVVSYAVDQTAITTDGWINLGQCQVDGENTDATKGLYNVVTMDGDSDGSDNNDACTPVEGTPVFSVAKATQQLPLVLAKDQTSVGVTYQVTVANVGNVEGTSPQVVDIPAVPAGFTIASVSVDGTVVPAPYVVTAGDRLAAGASVVHTVVVTFTVDQTGITEWTKLGECQVEGNGDPTSGLFNAVTMDGDSDGTENNDACVPVTAADDFAVEKTTTDERQDVDEFTTDFVAHYDVKVTNTGKAESTSPQVMDIPTIPAHFTLNKVTVDGADVTAADGGYLVTTGVKLAPGASKVFKLEAHFTVDYPAVTETQWEALRQCEAGETANPDLGLYNVVTMDGDSDGTVNNDACLPVEAPDQPEEPGPTPTPTPTPSPSTTPTPTPTEPELEQPERDQPNRPQEPTLARTGGDATTAGVIAGFFAVIVGGVLVGRRRR